MAEKQWYIFDKVMHIAVKAECLEEALERIEEMAPRTDREAEIDFDPDIVEVS